MRNKKMILLSSFAALTMSLYSCKGDKAENTDAENVSETETVSDAETEEVVSDQTLAFADFVDLDLSSEGMPVVIKAPKDARIIEGGDQRLFIYGGKRFKLTLEVNEDDTAEEYLEYSKAIVMDKEINPDFDKFIDESDNGFLSKDTYDIYWFYAAVPYGDSCIVIEEGMDFDKSPDQFTLYSEEDTKLMYQSAASAVVK